MNVRILMLGKNKDEYIAEGIADFSKKISPFCRLDLVYVKDERVHDDVKKVLEKEADRVLEALSADDFVVVLDDEGKLFTTEQFSAYLSNLQNRGTGKIVLIIGSAHGLSPRIIARANLVWSLSPMTMNHQIVRLVLLEQLYRVFTLQRGMKYHK